MPSGRSPPLLNTIRWPSPFQPLGNPTGVVLGEQSLIDIRASPICPRINPAVKQIAPRAAFAPFVTGSFGRGGAVIDNPDFAEVVDADDKLIEIGVVSDRIDVRPIGISGAALQVRGRWADLASFNSVRSRQGVGPLEVAAMLPDHHPHHLT